MVKKIKNKKKKTRKTDLGEEMKEKLCEVICVAPWTSLNLICESATNVGLTKRDWKEKASMCKQGKV